MRHSWEKLREHAYRCKKCGVVRVNRPNPYGPEWFKDWTWPDGRTETNEGKTPPCEPVTAATKGPPMDTGMTTTPENTSALVPNDMRQMIEAAKGLDVNALEKLVALHERAADRVARQEFASAFAKFQRECPPIAHDKQADFKTSGGQSVRYSYATLAQMARAIAKPLHDNGFSYSWDTAVEGKTLKVTCTLEHLGGHKRTASFVCPVEPNKLQSDAQAAKAAQTFAERCSLISVAGLTTADSDIDGPPPEGEPETIGPGQLKTLEEMLVAIDASADSRRRFMAKYQIETLDRMHVAVFPLALSDLKAIAEKKGVKL